MRPTKTSSASELQECAKQAGCATVAEFVTRMFELLEDIEDHALSSRAKASSWGDQTRIDTLMGRIHRITRGF